MMWLILRYTRVKYVRRRGFMKRLKNITGQETVLVYGTAPEDVQPTMAILRSASLEPVLCQDIQQFCTKMVQAHCGVITQDAVLADGDHVLHRTLHDEPFWSDFPLMILVNEDPALRDVIEAMEAIGNMTLVEEPVRASELLRSVKAGLRDRKRQYAIRDQLIALEENTALLKTSEQRYELALRGVNDGLWDYNIETGELFMMPRFKEMIGYSDEELPSSMDNAIRHIHPEDLAAAVQMRDDYLTGKIAHYENEFRMIHKDGSIRWILSRGAATHDASGNVTRLTGTHTDITKQKKLEDQLKRSEETFSTMADAIPQLAWMGNEKGEIFWYNKRWTDYTNLRLEDMQQQSWQAVVHPDYAKPVMRRFAQAIDLGLAWEDTFPIRSKSGEYRWFLSRAFPISDSNAVRWFGTHTDITQQMEREKQLQISEERWKILTEAMPQLVWIDRASDRKCVYLSTQWETYTGLTNEALLAQEWKVCFHPDDQVATVAAWEKALAEKTVYDSEYRVRRHDGVYRWFKSRGVPVVDTESGEEMWYGTCTDIQDLVDAREKSAEANRAKTDFLANMSHEIRTPMNAVIGLSSILAMTKPLSEKQLECINTLQLSADALLSLINNLLDIEKIEARSIELEEIPFSVKELTQEVISVISVNAKEKGIQFEAVTDGDYFDDRQYLGDPTRLRQVLMNLGSNAIKFTEQGRVLMEISYHPHTDARFETISIAVRDTGIGITSSQKETIFHKFVQGDSSINRKYGGTGLGLAITKTLAEIMGGTITVESDVGVGSVFTVSIPLKILRDRAAVRPAALLATVAPSRAPQEKITLLLVEDYPANILVATTFLEQFGYACDVAHNGIEALEKTAARRYAAILMDVQMHEMNGLDATRVIRQREQQHGLPPVPIIGMTAHALAGDREICLNAGMDDYITKPFNPDELRQKLLSFLEKAPLIAE